MLVKWTRWNSTDWHLGTGVVDCVLDANCIHQRHVLDSAVLDGPVPDPTPDRLSSWFEIHCW